MHSFRQQIFDDALLFGGAAVRINPKVNLCVRKFRRSLFCPLARNGPEVGRIVRDKGKFVTLARAALLTGSNKCGARDQHAANQSTDDQRRRFS